MHTMTRQNTARKETPSLLQPAAPHTGGVRRTGGRSALLLGCVIVLALLVCASVAFGVREVSLHDIVAALGGAADTVGEAAVVTRLPRTVLAIMVGAALALSGAATATALTSLTSAVMLPRVDLLRTFQFWQIGGVGGATWDRIVTVAPVLAVGALIVFASAKSLNSLALGDDMAAGLGENVARARLVSMIGAVVLAGAATAVAGPIGFVGLIVPHLCRLMAGPDHRFLLPFTAFVGAALLLMGDVVGRLIAKPEEIEVGIVTALIGAPVFIWIVRRQRVRAL